MPATTGSECLNMQDRSRITLWVYALWTIVTFPQSIQQVQYDYLGSEAANTVYFQVLDGQPLFLNSSFCLDQISVEVTSSSTAYGDRNKNAFYIRIGWKSQTAMAFVKVESDSVDDSYCEAKNKHYYYRKPWNQSLHVFPDDVNKGIRFIPIKLDCKYIITPEMEGLCLPLKLRYSTPVCLDNVTCSCRNAAIPAPIMRSEGNKDDIHVLWSFPKNFRDISSIVILIYLEDGLNTKIIARRRTSVKNHEVAEGVEFKEKFRVNLTNDYDYRIQSYFENDVSCPGNSTFLRFRSSGTMERLRFEKILSYTMASAFLLLFIFTCLLFFCKKKVRKVCAKLFRSETVDVPNVQYSSQDSPIQKNRPPLMVCNPTYDHQTKDSYWFDYRDLVIIRKIAAGNFGVVYLAKSSQTLKGSNIFAIKQLKDKVGLEELDDFIEEINMFKLVGSHPNVVKMFGYCSSPYPPTIIMEYVPFNLLKYLKNLRAKFEVRKTLRGTSVSYAELLHSRSCSITDLSYISQSEIESAPLQSVTKREGNEPEYVLDSRELETFALQIAEGMAHLESKDIVHRDLAARNVLMDCYKNLKISDFGMSRTGIYVNKKSRKFPLRWMSPEAIVNRTYSNKSDVWSFGVVLWEIGTLGAFPYSSLQNEEVISFLKKGGQLDKPENVTSQLYQLMVECWSHHPEDRPAFKDLVRKLGGFNEGSNGYVEFDNLKANYVFPPMEEDVDKNNTHKSDSNDQACSMPWKLGLFHHHFRKWSESSLTNSVTERDLDVCA